MKSHAQNEFRQITSSAGLIGITAFFGALVGFVLQLLTAYYFGASEKTDAYFMALSTSELLSKLLLGGSITAVFIPMFVERISRGRFHDAEHLALNLIHLTAVLFIFLLVIIGFFAQPFVSFIAPGFEPATAALTVSLLRILLPSFAFLFLVELTTSVLHALKHFTTPALLRIVAPSISIISIILFVKSIGIYALAIGVVLGSIVQVFLLARALRRQGFSYHFIFNPFHPSIKKLLYLTYPFLFSVLTTQAAGIVYRILVSDLSSGSLAAIKFAEKITQFLAIVFLNSVTVVIYPILSEKAARHDMAGIKDTLASSVRLVTFVTVPIVCGVALLRTPIISFIYQRGSFTAHDAAMTSIALLFLVIGITTNGISSIFGHATLALKQTRAAVAVSISSQAIAISLFILLVPRMSLAGLALASSLVPLSIALLYFLFLTRYIPRLYSIFIHPIYAKIALLAALLTVAVLLLIPLTRHISSNSNISLLLNILLPSLTGAFIYITGAHLLNISEMNTITDLVRSKLRRTSTSNT